MSYQELLDKVQSYVRLNGKAKSNFEGKINMNVNNEEEEAGENEDCKATPIKEEVEEDWGQDDG